MIRLESQSDLMADLGGLSVMLRTAALQATTLNDALRFAKLYGRLHWDNISGHFGDEALEDALHKRWAGAFPATKQPALEGITHLHVASRVYGQGGHSRLLRYVSKGLAPYGRQALVLTDSRKTNDLSGMPSSILKLSGDPAARVSALVAAAAQAEAVLLHIHPDDIGAALAARILRSQGKKILFVNHADHVFSFGAGAASAVLEICATGWKTTKTRRQAVAQSFMGIPIVENSRKPEQWTGNRTGAIVSMGGGGKFQPSDKLSFPKLLAELLPRVPNKVVLIGPSAKDPWWRAVAEAFPDRIELRGVLPFQEVEEILKGCACYVDSFPLDGGTAYPQTAALGVPCFGLNAAEAPGVSPTDRLRFQSQEQLEEGLVAYLTGGDYPFDQDGVISTILQDFSAEAVSKRVLSALRGDCIGLPNYLGFLGQRSSDYNAKRWIDEKTLHLPKRIWKGLSFASRKKLLSKISKSDLSALVKKKLRQRIFLTW
ncbi:hypothetical protein [Pseudophaeobacter sp.]|uniref:hypothetical protein n=1 Tax=Pseudophaeobacter sp. TaxID=1971739 RepID=UPI003296886D